MATEKEEKSIYLKLIDCQSRLNAPKNQYNSFGDYKYRTTEDILIGVKPLLEENGLCLTLDDELIEINGEPYVCATATIFDRNSRLSTKAYAKIDFTKKKMDASQQCGSASTYARKYALNGMFLIDDMKDADTNEHKKEADERSKQAGTKKQDEAPEMPTKEEIEQFRAYLGAEGISEEYVCYSCGIKNITMITKKLFDKFADNKNLPALKEAHDVWLKKQEAKKNE